MARHEKPDVIVVSSKGQVVIPQSLRQKLGIGPKSKLLVYGYDDALIMKKLDISDVEKKLQALFKRIDKRTAKFGKISQEEVQQEIDRYRAEKRRQKGTQ